MCGVFLYCLIVTSMPDIAEITEGVTGMLTLTITIDRILSLYLITFLARRSLRTALSLDRLYQHQADAADNEQQTDGKSE